MARASNDLDLVARTSLELAGERLRQAAAADLDDGITFAIVAGSRSITGNNRGHRFTIEARIGPYRLGAFRVDVVVDWTNTKPLDTVSPASPIPAVAYPGPPWRVYPIADHLADKVCATYEIALPLGYLLPDQAMWERGGFTKLRRAAGPLGAGWPSYPEAVTVAQALLDPVLADERHNGTWDPATRQWIDEHSRPDAR